MSMFQNVQAAAALGQQNAAQQAAMQKWIDGRNDEMYRRYAEKQRQLNQTSREIFNPTFEKMFSQMMEGSAVGEFLATAAGKKRVKVAEAIKMAEMDAQDSIQARMLEGAKSAPFMTIGGQTGPTDQGNTPADTEAPAGAEVPAKSGEAGDTPPATAKSPSNVRIPKSATPAQAAAIQGVASRSAPERFGYSFPQLKISQNPYGGLIAENAQTGERFVFSEEALGAMGNAIEAENEALRADATMTFAKNMRTQSNSDTRFENYTNQIMGDIALKDAIKEGLISPEEAAPFFELGIRPTQKELQMLKDGRITRNQLIRKLSEEKYQARRKQNDDEMSFLNSQISVLDRQILSLMKGSSGGDSDYGGSDPAALRMGEGGMPSVVDHEALSKLRNERNNLAMQRSYYAQANSAMFNHNLHGMSNNLLQGIEAGTVDRNALLGIMKIAATDVSAISDPERAMRLLPGEVKNTEEFITKMMPAIMRAGASLGWNMDAGVAEAFVDLYITDVNDRVSKEVVRKKRAEEDDRIALQRDLTVADQDYLSQFTQQQNNQTGSGGISTAQAMEQGSDVSRQQQEFEGIIDSETGVTQSDLDAFKQTYPGMSVYDDSVVIKTLQFVLREDFDGNMASFTNWLQSEISKDNQ